MTKQHSPPVDHHQSPQRALLIGVQTPDESDEQFAASCRELEHLARTLGISVVEQRFQKRRQAASSTYVGSGKLEELAQLTAAPNADSSAKSGADVVLVDDAIEARQHRSLELKLGVDVIDRTGLILEIFEKRAQTRAARLEVEIARLHYELPRLRDDAKGDDRRGGGGRGERGHTNVELGKQRIRDRIAELKSELQEVQQTEATRRDQRQHLFQVALVGYTNAGKSSILHGLTDSDILVEDKLFATLGTTVRALEPPTTPPILISDTVGFIKNLPHEFVASFQSTLDEALDAQMIVNVVDASDPEWPQHLRVTRETLHSIGADGDELSTQLVFNKVDAIDDETKDRLAREFPAAIQMSALDADDLHRLRNTLIETRDLGLCEETLLIPFEQGEVLGEIHDRAAVIDESHTTDGTVLHLRARSQDFDRWRSKIDTPPAADSPGELAELASHYGLDVSATTDEFDESGLDFRILRVTDSDDRPWILRAPRRADVFDASRVEHRALRLIASELSVDTPDWQLHTPELIAYPEITGRPGWTITDEGTPDYRGIDADTPSAAALKSIAEMLVELQSIGIDGIQAAGLPIDSIDEVRRQRREFLDEVEPILRPDDALLERWNRWLDDRSIWPDHTALIHGDFHPGHMLFDDTDVLTGILDWTEVQVGDPAQDLAIFYGCFDRAVLDAIIEHFAASGGQVWDGIGDHVEELWAFSPVVTASWALEHDHDEALKHARSMMATIQ